MIYIVLALLILGVYLIFTAYEAIVKRKKIDDKTFYIALAVAIIVPIFLFAFIVPSVSLEGNHKEYSKVTSAAGKDYSAMVEYYVFENVQTHFQGDNEYENHSIVYCPKTIYWSNGGHSDNSLDDYGEIGDKVSFIDQEGHEYQVTIPKMNFSYYDQLKAIGTVDKICYSLIFISSIAIIICKFREK